MIPVTSSTIHSIGHDAETGKLRVKFHDYTSKKTGATTPGAVYEYGPHPELADHHTAMLAHDADPDKSVGTYFAVNVKKGGYPFAKVG